MISLENLTVTVFIRRLLLADQEISSLVGTRIYPSIAPKDTPSPFITYERDSYDVEDVKMGSVREMAFVSFAIVSDDYDTGLQIAVSMHRVLQGEHEGKSLDIVNSLERYNEGKFIQIIDFKIT